MNDKKTESVGIKPVSVTLTVDTQEELDWLGSLLNTSSVVRASFELHSIAKVVREELMVCGADVRKHLDAITDFTKPAPSIWKGIDDKYKYLAQDKDGDWFAYVSKPDFDTHLGKWIITECSLSYLRVHTINKVWHDYKVCIHRNDP